MDIKLVQFSIVVVANEHNPSLINPDFLEREGIIDNRWGLERVGDAITTPPFATVSYKGGITVTVEANKFQVVDQECDEPTQSYLPDIVARYIEVLPHVPYVAVGINFNGIMSIPDPASYLENHFLKNGGWDSTEHPLESVGLRFVYSRDGGRVVLTVDPAHKANNRSDEAILVKANFHRDCDDETPAAEQVNNFIRNVEADWKYYLKLVSDALYEEA